MQTDSPFSNPLPTPVYPDVSLYNLIHDGPRAWEYSGWKAESLSWKSGCYIHAGLSGPSEATIQGPDAASLLSKLSINDLADFEPGRAKHAVMCDEDGLIAAHAVLQRDAADSFRWFAAGMWPHYQAAKANADVRTSIRKIYLFQVSGPTSLELLEKVTGESLSDLRFMRSRIVRIGGVPSEICRLGMSGTLGFELRGPYAEGPQVFDSVYRAGQDFGIERLGWRTYRVNHIEGGFPQAGWTFTPSMLTDDGFLQFMASKNGQPHYEMPMVGSVEPSDVRARLRTPVEVGWEKLIRLDHDFIGRSAVERELADPRRTIVTLRWNAEDVVDIHASLLRPGQEYKTLDFPTPHGGHPAHADHVLRDGVDVGVSSGTIYSYYYREVISHCTIDRDAADIGTEVTVQWGDFGGPIKNVRATVARYPYLDLKRNDVR